MYFAEDKATYRIKKGKEGFVSSLSAYFPNQREALQAYADAIYRMTDDIKLFHLQPSTEMFPIHSEEFTIAADSFIAKYIQDPKLRSVVAYMNPLYGGRSDETPALYPCYHQSTLYAGSKSLCRR